MRLPRSLRAVLGFVVASIALAAVGGLAGIWQVIDHRVFVMLQGDVHPLPAAGLRIIDLAIDSGRDEAAQLRVRRHRLTELIERLARSDKPPGTLVVDLWIAATANEAEIEPMLAAIDALRRRGSGVYFAVNLLDRHGRVAGDALAHHRAALYGTAIDGYGHTLFEVAHGIVSYAREIRVRAGPDDASAGEVGVWALAIASTTEPGLRAGLPSRLVVPLGDDAMMVARTRAVAAEAPRGAASSRGIATDGWLDGATHVIVGDIASDRDNLLERPGPYVLGWAISDLLAGRMSVARAPVTSPLVVLATGLLAALVAAVGFQSLFHVLRLRFVADRWRGVAIVSGGLALSLVVILLAVLQALALAADRVLPVALAAALGILAVVIATRTALGWVADSSARHVAPDAEKAAAYDVFISYAHDPAENARWVEENVYAPLAAMRDSSGRPYRIFFDRRSIEVGRKWKQDIELALLGTRCFVPVICDRYFARPYCREELELADQLRIEDRLYIVPVAREPAKLPERFRRKFQYLDASARDDVAQALARAVTQALSPPDPGRP
ncbi:MAG: toll/interleukin-1 receptor domain-containing protein [Burkholderiaceae bacterium]